MSWLYRIRWRTVIAFAIGWICVGFGLAWSPALWLLWQAGNGRAHNLAAVGVGYTPAFWILMCLPPVLLGLARWRFRGPSADSGRHRAEEEWVP